MKIKVSEASGPVLDWMVAKCEGHLESRRVVIDMEFWVDRRPFIRFNPTPQVYYEAGYEPSTNWAHGGPIIDLKKISVVRDEGDDYWQAVMNTQSGSMFGPGLCGDHWASGPTALIAAMRCLVTSELGNEVDVPEELV